MRSSGRILLLLSIAAVSRLPAADHFLTIGGGYEPQGNQVSLERNVEFFAQVLAEQRPDNPPHDIYFADGDDRHRDLQFRDPDFDCSPGRRLGIELFGEFDSLDIAYRNHNVQNVLAETSPRRIRDRLRELGRQMSAGDRLMLYATAHGGSGEEKTPYNTTLYTWNHRSVRASELASWLNDLPQTTPVVMVMVQCYAGGFSHVIYNDANPAKDLSPQLRAGFFAQVHDRPAAGCTPDVDKQTYQEYSTYFWAALAGHDRAGVAVTDTDLDGDGVTSMAEAHAYAVCESETVDIPIRTSDEYLRYYSTDGGAALSLYEQANPSSGPQRSPSGELVEAKGPLADLLRHARPIDRAIVDRLLEKLGLDPSGGVEQVERALAQARQQVSRDRRSASRASSNYRRTRDRLASGARREWPELDAELSPMLAALLAERADEFERQVSAMPGYSSLVGQRAEKERTADALLDAKKDEALVLRLEHMLDRVARDANLPKVASPQLVDRYNQLLALESSTLAPLGDGPLQQTTFRE
ncbi:hypothetical protein Pla175_50300 [Pirellulimonas nuda]|uniref:Caspase domain protein n=1 Tax=Pirellulimonas nuda TaxID=2528009 RepID=A0A518DJE6_9BACT|nr:hypothetical protein [Pirellulimonas nuda]QDU91600.1 hypothetical protein Pla175_50300 [Pirellulimonas nuda]